MDNNQAFPNANQNTQPNPSFDIPPAVNNQAQPQNQGYNQFSQAAQNGFQPTQTGSLNDPTAPNINNTGVNLESPILAPTHFDGMKPAQIQNPNPMPATPAKPKSYMGLAIAFGAFAILGIILGVVSLVLYITTNDDLETANKSLEDKTAIVNEVQKQTGKAINTVADLPEYSAVTGYIYVSEWGIKFKIPSDIADLSYILDQKYRPQICFNGYQTGTKYFPGFADIDQNPGGMGCITRVASYEGESDKDSGYSFGEKVYSYNDFNYFYNAPARVFSSSEAEKGLESTAVQIIKNMLTNNISHYE